MKRTTGAGPAGRHKISTLDKEIDGHVIKHLGFFLSWCKFCHRQRLAKSLLFSLVTDQKYQTLHFLHL